MSSRETARRFHFIRPIASGGFGTVYLCKVVHADGFSRIVAVKLLNNQWSDSDDVTKRIRDEARLLGLLRHRNIVDVIDLTSIDGRTAVIMEYLEAVDLRYLLQYLRAANQRLPVRVALEVVSQVASALDAAYNRPPMSGDKPLRVIHRDIKPSNIMLDSNGLPKVLDFGVAQSDIANREADTQELQFGSVEYMAPERLFFEPETPASDVYSLAVTLYELIAMEKLGKARGRPEKHAAQVTERLQVMRRLAGLDGELADSLDQLLEASLHFEHEQRPDAAEFSEGAKQLARAIQDDDLVTWSERVLPPVVAQSETRAHKAEPMSDSVMTEDSVAFVDSGGPRTDEFSVELRTSGNQETERAAALRRGALAELEESGDLVFSPATGSPEGDGRGAIGPVGEGTDGIGWNDRTLGDLTDGGRSRRQNDGPPAPQPPISTGLLDEIVPGLGPEGEMETTETTVGTGTLGGVPEHSTLDGIRVGKIRSPMMYLGLGGCMPLLLALIGGGFVVMQDVGGVRTELTRFLGATPSSEEVAQSAASTSATDALATVVETPGLRFVSEWENTKKIFARCEGGKGKGTTEAIVAIESSGMCAVTGILESGQRQTATVENATIGTYLCFADGADECRRQ